MIVDRAFARRGADAGLAEGRRVRAITDPIARGAALAAIKAMVTTVARQVRAEGATADQATIYAIAWRCGLDAAMRGQDGFEMHVKLKPAVRH